MPPPCRRVSPPPVLRRLLPAAVLVLGQFVATSGALATELPGPMHLVSVRKIWDQAPHSAFGDLIRYRDTWFCTFREDEKHASYSGSVRVITSTDGEVWKSAAQIISATSDLRDPHFSVAPDGQLMMTGLERYLPEKNRPHQSLTWFSNDGVHWSSKHAIGDPNTWLWRVTWHRGTAYTMGYSIGPEPNHSGSIRLYSSRDGKQFTTLADGVL